MGEVPESQPAVSSPLAQADQGLHEKNDQPESGSEQATKLDEVPF